MGCTQSKLRPALSVAPRSSHAEKLTYNVLGSKIAPFLDHNEYSFARVNRFWRSSNPLSARQGRKLLDYVAKGDQDKAEKLLKEIPSKILRNNPTLLFDLLTHCGEIKDYAGRVFSNISAFQYALWAKDVYMARMLLKTVPGGRVGHKTRQALLEQYQAVTSDGVEYTWKSETKKENHFDFTPLLTAYQTYIDCFDTWTDLQKKTHWCTIVGGAQKDLPANIAQHYSIPSPRTSFYLFPRELTIYHYDNNSHTTLSIGEFWWSTDSRLGIDFAVYRGEAFFPLTSVPKGGRATYDFEAMKSLNAIRTSEISHLPDVIFEKTQTTHKKIPHNATCFCS